MTRTPYAVVFGVSTALVLILTGGGWTYPGGGGHWAPGPAGGGHFGGGGFRQGPPAQAAHFPTNFHSGAYQGGAPAPAMRSAPAQFGGGHFGGGRMFAPAPAAASNYAKSSYNPASHAPRPAPVAVHSAPGYFGGQHFGDRGGRRFAPAPVTHYAGQSYTPAYRVAGLAPAVGYASPEHFGRRHYGGQHYSDGRGERRFAPAPAPIYAGHAYRQAYRDAGPAPAVWHRARQPVRVAQLYDDGGERQAVPMQRYHLQAGNAPQPQYRQQIYAARVRPGLRIYQADDSYAGGELRTYDAPRAAHARQSAYYEAPLVETYQEQGAYIQRAPAVVAYSRPRAAYYNAPQADFAPGQAYGQQGARVYYVSRPQTIYQQRAYGERHRAYAWWGHAGG